MDALNYIDGKHVGAAEWLENYRKFWEGNYQRLDALLEELKHTRREP